MFNFTCFPEPSEEIKSERLKKNGENLRYGLEDLFAVDGLI